MTDVVERTAQGLRFTVLRGTVGAEVDGEAVSLGGPRQRRLLAALLAAAALRRRAIRARA